jgi:hypothetical protein
MWVFKPQYIMAGSFADSHRAARLDAAFIITCIATRILLVRRNKAKETAQSTVEGKEAKDAHLNAFSGEPRDDHSMLTSKT